MQFVKVTFLLTWLEAEKPALKNIELDFIDHTHQDSFLYDSYLEVMLLAYKTIKESNSTKSEFLTTELNHYIQKTNLKIVPMLLKP